MSHRNYIVNRGQREPRFTVERQAAAAELALGEALVRRRHEWGSTLAQLAEQTGIAEERLEAIEEGESMTFHEVLWLLHALEVSMSADAVDRMQIDRRWVCVERPTLVVGGELTMSQLEITRNTATGISEAPLQIKSNCGTLVIDDFGRQRMSIAELLNRWIVPLDRRYDYLNLPSGKTIQVPFDQLLVFSTNLEPRDLVDEAFLRRIPYKIEVFDPSEHEFRDLFRMYAERFGFEPCEASVDYLIENHYRRAARPFRFCHPRDLLLQVRNYCQYNRLPIVMSPEKFDLAVRNYFAVMG